MPYPPVDEMAAGARRAAQKKSSKKFMDGYTAEERGFLIAVARQAIEAALGKREFFPEPLTPKTAEPRGVFTTLHIDDQLRGCVGHVLAQDPLVRAVAQTAVAAAFSDPRFSPLTDAEFPKLKIELSVLSPLERILPREVVVGKHGLLIAAGGYRGLLLPQVATEFGWDAETFLEQTCRKAGLPPSTWHSPNAEIYAFTAELIEE